MVVRKRTPKAKKASGRNVEEWERGTERLTLRLRPEAMQLLYSLATEMGEGDPSKHLSKTVEAALHALSREMDAEVGASVQSSEDA